jgi:hypothetical protein
MTLTRIYVPLDAAGLRDLSVRRALAGPPLVAHAVTEAVRVAQPASDEEEREYTALCDAAATSARLLPPGEHRRIVVAADVEPGWVDEVPQAEGTTPSQVMISRPVPLKRIASFHVDEDGATEDDELLWYDATELPVVIDLL